MPTTLVGRSPDSRDQPSADPNESPHAPVVPSTSRAKRRHIARRDRSHAVIAYANHVNNDNCLPKETPVPSPVIVDVHTVDDMFADNTTENVQLALQEEYDLTPQVIIEPLPSSSEPSLRQQKAAERAQKAREKAEKRKERRKAFEIPPPPMPETPAPTFLPTQNYEQTTIAPISAIKAVVSYGAEIEDFKNPTKLPSSPCPRQVLEIVTQKLPVWKATSRNLPTLDSISPHAKDVWTDVPIAGNDPFFNFCAHLKIPIRQDRKSVV